MDHQELRYQRRLKSQSRRAMAFSIFSFINLLMVAAFASRIFYRLGIPTTVTYTVAGIVAALTLTLNLGSDLNGISKKIYILIAQLHIILLGLLNFAMVPVALLDSNGLNKGSLMSIGIFILFYIINVFALRFLIKVIGTEEEDSSEEIKR